MQSSWELSAERKCEPRPRKPVGWSCVSVARVKRCQIMLAEERVWRKGIWVIEVLSNREAT